jgi:ketosteroid isomerase-like protein
MSQQDVDAVREALEAFNSGDVARIVALTHADFDAVIPPELSAEPDTYRGHDGIRRYLESFTEAMEEIRFEAERISDLGSSVLVLLLLTARGRQTSIPVEQRSAGVWSIRDGKVLTIRAFASSADALAAVGLAR